MHFLSFTTKHNCTMISCQCNFLYNNHLFCYYNNIIRTQRSLTYNVYYTKIRTGVWATIRIIIYNEISCGRPIYISSDTLRKYVDSWSPIIFSMVLYSCVLPLVYLWCDLLTSILSHEWLWKKKCKLLRFTITEYLIDCWKFNVGHVGMS